MWHTQTHRHRRVAAADGPKNEKLLRDPKIARILTAEHPTVPAITTDDAGHELAGCDTHNNTQDHTGDANMTSLSIRLTVSLREVINRDALAQRTAFARAPREHHTHIPSSCAIEACCSR